LAKWYRPVILLSTIRQHGFGHFGGRRRGADLVIDHGDRPAGLGPDAEAC
jgi:hypothetical protein